MPFKTPLLIKTKPWTLLLVSIRLQKRNRFSTVFDKSSKGRSPGGFREEKREEKTVEVPLLARKPQSGKIREVSGKRNGKRNGKRETAFHKNPQSGKIREDSGKNSRKRCEHCKTCFDSVSMCF